MMLIVGQRGGRGALGLLAAVAAAIVCAPLAAQSSQFQFVLSAFDARALPVTDLMPAEIVVTENGAREPVTKIEPFPIPVKLTIAVDNGTSSTDAIAHYRTGLTRLLDALPSDIEVTLLTIAPQPRIIVRSTADRVKIRRGITGFAPEDAQPRFTDALVEYSRRLEDEVRYGKTANYLPVLLIVSTNASDAHSYQVSEIQKALSFLITRRARVIVTMTTTHGDPVTNLNDSRQVLIAIPATKLTGGRYEAIAGSNRLTTLLPEIGQEIAALHVKHSNQLLVTAQRGDGLSGPLQHLEIRLARPGASGSVSGDGFPPRPASTQTPPTKQD